MSITVDQGTATDDGSTTSEEQIGQALAAFADGFAQSYRAPVLHTPTEEGLDFETVTFPATDGVPLEGWFIPCEGSDKLIVVNHPMGFSRSGQPSDLEPWRSVWGPAGNDFEINFVPDLKILHDHGYNLLTYDLRNHGISGSGSGGVSTSGIMESRDVLGSLAYARSRPDTREMTSGLFSRCLGCNSTMYAMKSDPAAFEGVRCMVGPEPVDTRTILTHQLVLAGLPADCIDDLDRRVKVRTSFDFDSRSQHEWAKHVSVPTFLYSVKDDVLVEPGDVQTTYDNIPVQDKKLFWIEGTTRRWDGYQYFQKHPEQMLGWFATHMA